MSAPLRPQDFGNQFALYGPTYVITVTNWFLAPEASWCVQFGDKAKECPTTPIPKPTTSTVSTRYFAPLTIEQPSSCTKTSFSYTSSQQVFPANLQPTSLLAEATESAQAWFITTYVVTISTNRGGQAVTTSLVDVYLSANAVQGILPLSQSSLLNECVDPPAPYVPQARPMSETTAVARNPSPIHQPRLPGGNGGGSGGGGGRHPDG